MMLTKLQNLLLAAFLCGFGYSGALNAQAQADSSSNVTVHSVFPKLIVVVARTSSLQSVLKELCQQARAECNGIEPTASYNVVPSTFRGTWSEVISQLMEGTSLNYAAGPPSQSQPGKLIIQGQRGTLPPPANIPVQDFSRDTMAQVPTVSSVSPESAQSTSPADDSGPSAGVAFGRMAHGASPSPSTAGVMSSSYNSPGTIGSPLTSEMPIGTSRETPAFLPFPDSRGNLIPTSNEQIQYLPFPDSQGNLIPVKPVEPGGSPFPESAIRARH